MMFDSLYLAFILPALALSLWASWRTRSAFKKYSKVRTLSGLTGAQAAQRLLDVAGIDDVTIVATRGTLSDHYNPVTKKLALSEPVYGTASVAAVGVACHEAGHAIQHARAYKPLWIRSMLVPTANIGSSLGYLTMMLGLFLVYAGQQLGQMVILFGAVLFSAVLLFQVVTLPVEFDASARAKKQLMSLGILQSKQEAGGVSAVLNAAAMTYVAATITAVMQLLYFAMRAGLLGRRS
jgi:Zn-dependent membrane protease YugP